MATNKKDQDTGSQMKETGTAPTIDAPDKSGKKTQNPAPKASDKIAKKPPQPDKANGKSSSGESKKAQSEPQVVEQVKDIRQFLKEVYIEFQKITWPERSQVIRETYSVLFLVAVITLMVLAFDWAIGASVFGPLEHWARLHGGGIGRG